MLRSGGMSSRSLWLLLALSAAACGPPALPPTFPVEGNSGATTVDGEIVGVDERSPSASLAEQPRVVLTLGGDPPLQVWLAPAWYLEERGLSLEPSQRVEVRGRPLPDQNANGVEAHTLRLGERVFELRDLEGRPLWKE